MGAGGGVIVFHAAVEVHQATVREQVIGREFHGHLEGADRPIELAGACQRHAQVYMGGRPGVLQRRGTHVLVDGVLVAARAAQNRA